MKISELAAYVRWKANVDANSPYDNTTLLPIFNMAKNDVAQAIAQVNPNYFAETSTTTTVSGQSYYAKPTDFLLFRRMDVSYSGTDVGDFTPTRMTTLAEFNYGEDWFSAYSDTSHPLIREEGGYFYIYPAPTATTAGAQYLKLWYVPLPADFTDLSLTTEIFTLTGIGKPFHKLIGDEVVNEIRGKKGELTASQVLEANMEIRDTLIPAAFSSISTFSNPLPNDTYLQN
jgi:hypothetical protein